MADKEKLKEEIKTGGPKMLRPALKVPDTVGDNFRKKLKKAFSKKKTFENPMKMERKKEGFRSKNPNVKFADEMDAMITGLKTLTSEGPGRLKVGSMAKGGRAGLKSGGKGCKLAMKGKGRAYGKNS
jgi:hypothetical protein